MGVVCRLDLHRYGDQLSVAHPTLRDHASGEITDVIRCAAQYRDLKAALVVEMHMHRRQRQIVVVVKRAV